MESEITNVPRSLAEAVEQVKKGEEPSITVRQFLRWFGNERRGWRVVYQIRGSLKFHDLQTVPDFEGQWIDGYIKLKKATVNVKLDGAGAQLEGTGTVSDPVVGGASEDSTYRIGKLDAANKPPVYVKPDAPLNEAITIMLRDDFSQLPVMTNDREVKGAITWRTIAKRLSFVGPCSTVRECMVTSVETVTADASLFAVIELIAKHDFVLVKDHERKISGIVTTFDLGNSFHELARPFLLLSEIENHLRGIIAEKFSVKELQDVRNPNDPDREIEAVSDLTFGEYVRLLQNPDSWAKVKLAIDRPAFTKDLERVNGIRNDVMHFDPDGIAPDDLTYLGKQARFMQELREIASISSIPAASPSKSSTTSATKW